MRLCLTYITKWVEDRATAYLYHFVRSLKSLEDLCGQRIEFSFLSKIICHCASCFCSRPIVSLSCIFVFHYYMTSLPSAFVFPFPLTFMFCLLHLPLSFSLPVVWSTHLSLASLISTLIFATPAIDLITSVPIFSLLFKKNCLR